MKLVTATAFGLLARAVVEAASPSGASIFVYEPHATVPREPQQTLSPYAARGVIAQRAGVLRYHTTDLTDWRGNEIISAINNYGLHTSLKMDEKAAEQHYRTAVILLETDEGIDYLPSMLRDQRSFVLDPTPSSADARQLIVDLTRQSDIQLLKSRSEEEDVRSLFEEPKVTAKGDIFYITSSVTDFSKLLARLVQEGTHVTTLVISPTSISQSFEWGMYEVPRPQNLLNRREDTPTLRDVVEMTSGQVLKRQDTTYNGSLPGILPACYASQTDCDVATLNCTGHGSCTRKYSDSNDPSGGKACYSCQCNPTTSTNSRGQTKTTYWGGPACQKHDISTSFWLLALFTVGMVFLVGFAVGQIWSMGEEELPSVIGAGVSGPVKRS